MDESKRNLSLLVFKLYELKVGIDINAKLN